MSLPLILEDLYLKTVAKRTFPSCEEDSKQTAAEFAEISKFFAEISKRQGGTKITDLSDKRLLTLLKAYRGPRTPRIRIRSSVGLSS